MRDHFLGRLTLAPSCLDKHGRSLFLVFDVDRRFYDRLSVFAAVLRRRGLERAAFATEGSSFGRGKVVVTLRQPIPQAQAQALAASIIEEARADLLFGAEGADEVTVFPKGGSAAGNTVRLFGTNLARREGEATARPRSISMAGSLISHISNRPRSRRSRPHYHLQAVAEAGSPSQVVCPPLSFSREMIVGTDRLGSPTCFRSRTLAPVAP